jgi:hypothetical protein
LTADQAGVSVSHVPIGLRPQRRIPSDYAWPWRGWLVAVLIVTLPFLLRASPEGAAIAVCAVLAASFATLAWSEPIAFLSIAAPAGVGLLLGLAVRPLGLVVDEGVAVFVALFMFLRTPFAVWWWRTVLRRPKVAFAIELSTRIREMPDFRRAVGSDARKRARTLAAAHRQLKRITALSAPSPEWRELQLAYVTRWEAIVAMVAGAASYDAWAVELDRSRTEPLQARFDELVAQG